MKFKETGIAIQPSSVHHSSPLNDIYGLGSDEKMYIWDYQLGRWLKHWDWENDI